MVKKMSSPLNLKDLRRVFDNLDKNGDGLLSLEELNWLLDRIGHRHNPEELELSVGKSHLDFYDFLMFYNSILGQRSGEEIDSPGDIKVEGACPARKEEGDLFEAFRVFDLDGDGFISCEELQRVLARLGMGDERSDRDCRRMINKYDTNRDGLLDFEEFKNMMLLTSS